MAENVGLEPTTLELTALCSTNWANLPYGGKCGIWTHEAFTLFSFQDWCIQPLYQLSIIGGSRGARTLNPFGRGF